MVILVVITWNYTSFTHEDIVDKLMVDWLICWDLLLPNLLGMIPHSRETVFKLSLSTGTCMSTNKLVDMI